MEAKIQRIARLIGLQTDPSEAEFYWRHSPTLLISPERQRA
jgi:hypothetical protein